jgi:hypothetical protein
MNFVTTLVKKLICKKQKYSSLKILVLILPLTHVQAQSSLANIPFYVMQTCSIPISICEDA